MTDFVNEAMQEILPDDDNTSGVFCVVPDCDPNYSLLLEATKKLPNKRTYN